MEAKSVEWTRSMAGGGRPGSSTCSTRRVSRIACVEGALPDELPSMLSEPLLCSSSAARGVVLKTSSAALCPGEGRARLLVRLGPGVSVLRLCAAARAAWGQVVLANVSLAHQRGWLVCVGRTRWAIRGADACFRCVIASPRRAATAVLLSMCCVFLSDSHSCERWSWICREAAGRHRTSPEGSRRPTQPWQPSLAQGASGCP